MWNLDHMNYFPCLLGKCSMWWLCCVSGAFSYLSDGYQSVKPASPPPGEFLTSWHGFTLALSPVTCLWGNPTCQFHTVWDVMGSKDPCLAGDLFVHHNCNRSQMHQISLSCTEQNAHALSLQHIPGPLEISTSAIGVVSSNFWRCLDLVLYWVWRQQNSWS